MHSPPTPVARPPLSSSSTPPAPTRRQPLLGAVLFASAALGAIGGVLLAVVFGWPDVLGEPGTVALPRFAADQAAIRGGFTLLLFSSLLLVPAAVGLEAALSRPTPAVRVFTVLGVAGALFQVLGWVRWPVAVPGLAERYLAPGADESTRAATTAAYDVLNDYAGGAVGEHLGWLFQGPWAIAVGVLTVAAVGVPRWFALVGLGTAVVWTALIVPAPYIAALGPDSPGALVGNLAYTVWFVWIGALGVLVAVRRVGAPDLPASSPSIPGARHE